MKKVFSRPKSLKDMPFHYCPGCTHGIVHRLVAEVIDEMDMFDRTIAVAPVGCSVFCYEYFDCDAFQASHGRAPAVATGIKRVLPDRMVFTYQGDGDLAAIGAGEIVHAAARGEKFTVIFINNAIYAMTGGQMAPTTLMGQVTTTTPYGRDRDVNGCPVRMSEMLSVLDGSAYIARVSVHSPANVIKAKKAIKKAFEVQMAGEGFTMVEVLSSCPTNWGLSPIKALKWLEDNMIPYYPLGEYKRNGDTPPLFWPKSGGVGGMSPIERNGDTPQRDGDSPQRNGDTPQRDGDSPQRNGDSPQRDGDSPQRNGDSPQRNGDTPPLFGPESGGVGGMSPINEQKSGGVGGISPAKSEVIEGA